MSFTLEAGADADEVEHQFPPDPCGRASCRHPEWTANYVQEYTRKNYTADISLGKIALELHLTPERLCRLYKEHFGRTIREEINALRVKKACGLLQERSLSVSEICRLSGFRDLSNFHRVFRSFKDFSPHQFRRRRNGK